MGGSWLTLDLVTRVSKRLSQSDLNVLRPGLYLQTGTASTFLKLFLRTNIALKMFQQLSIHSFIHAHKKN